ncbi:MAG: Stk1 family PASTA domain-containing Ser/Thr kinase [Actinobacteria bacterium]|nr:Stk1 family PASTA domain-containing Ser/Thr kinase [Actinomycetota bacterium]
MEQIESRVYGGRYELSHHIARGGMAEVYRANDRLLGRPVALKILFPELSVDRSFVERFRREAQAAANLSHPHIVPVFDWGEDQGTYFIVMEFVDGDPLSAILRSSGTLQPERAADIAADVADALAYAHRHGVVHRDVKPGNILITDDGEVKVTDFGIARAVNTEESLTQTGAVMGTATYFSPEQAQGYGVDGRSDIYSLGVVLYEMVTGRPPFTGDTPVAVASKHVRDQLVPPRQLNPGVPPDMEAVIMKAMAKSPELRYQTADAMRTDLRRFSQGQRVHAEPATTVLGIGGQTTMMAGVGAGAGTQMLIQAPRASDLSSRPMDESKERSRTGIYAGVLVVLLAALIVVGFLLGRSLGYFGGTPSSFSLPGVVGEQAATATKTLESKGLVVHVNHEHNAARSGTVFKTQPGPGASVSKGQTVLVYVSSGPSAPAVSMVSVPNLIGLTKTGATQQLSADNLIPHFISQADSNATAGTVIAQSPGPNKRIKSGSTVDVTLAVAPTPTDVDVPNVTGDTPAQAGAVLAKDGFTVGTTTTQPSSTIGNGYVIGTNPPKGTPEPPNTSINLIVSSGPSQVTVENVIGDTKSQAESILTGSGLTPVVVCQTTLNPSDVGLVIDQSPAGGQVVPAGSDVTIDVGEAPGSGVSPTTTTTTTTTTTPAPLHGPGSHYSSANSGGSSGSAGPSC